MLCIVFVALLVQNAIGLRYIEIGNRNRYPIWIQSLGNRGYPPLLNGAIKRVDAGSRIKYNIADAGWAGRLWPKTGCDTAGNNCEFGQSQPPCPNGGCHPPSSTLIEFNFPAINSPDASWYDISLVDGYSMGAEIVPYKDGKKIQQGSCIRTDCHVTFAECPRNEKNGLGNLKATGRSGNLVGCLSPCRKWSYPAPWGQGRNEGQGDGRLLCCPKGVSVEECRRGIVVQTEFVKLVHRACPTAYSYSYDDEGGLHNCPAAASFSVNYYT